MNGGDHALPWTADRRERGQNGSYRIGVHQERLRCDRGTRGRSTAPHVIISRLFEELKIDGVGLS
jgi:hypothetical protein